jgi:hypothetical protein
LTCLPVAGPSTARQGGYGPIQPRRPGQLVRDVRPNKVRRVSGSEFSGGSSSSSSWVQHVMKNQVTPRLSGVKGRGKEREEDFVTPLSSRTVGQKRLDDYSAFKGRGRYARGGDARYNLINPSFLLTTLHLLISFEFSAGKTLNTLYAIDPAQNGGVDYPYDEVVRGKEQRRQLNAGDCERCRRECFLILLSALSYTDALDSTTKPLAPSPIAYNNHYGAHLPASPAHDILTKTSLIKDLVPPANARSTHTKKPSRVIGIRGHARIRRLGIGILGSRIRRRWGILMRGLRRCIGRRGRRWSGRLGVGVGSIGGGEVVEGDVAEESGLCAFRMFPALTCFIFVTLSPLPLKTRALGLFYAYGPCSPCLQPGLSFTLPLQSPLK